MARSEVLEALKGWVDAGLITDEQARAIRRHEAGLAQRELPGWVEPVAYLGAALVAVALFLFGVGIWDQLTIEGRVALGTLITLVLFGAGAFLGRSQSAPARRAASFAWFLTIGGVAGTTGLILSDIIDVNSDRVPVLTALVSLLGAVMLYLAARTTMQQVAIALSTIFALVTLPQILPLGEEPWIIGMTFLAVGAVWLLLTWAGYLAPSSAGWVLGSLFAIGVGIGSFDDNAVWSGIGIVVGLTLVWLSTRVDRRSLLAMGVLALLIWIPATVTILFEESMAVPVAILITGFVTLTVVVAAVRVGRRGGGIEPALGGGDTDVPA